MCLVDSLLLLLLLQVLHHHVYRGLTVLELLYLGLFDHSLQLFILRLTYFVKANTLLDKLLLPVVDLFLLVGSARLLVVCHQSIQILDIGYF